jgi:hypothetical protein
MVKALGTLKIAASEIRDAGAPSAPPVAVRMVKGRR